MSEPEETALVETGRSRQWGKAVLIGLVVVAVVLATGLTPALGSLAGDTPASSVVPVPGGGDAGQSPVDGQAPAGGESSAGESGSGASGSEDAGESDSGAAESGEPSGGADSSEGVGDAGSGTGSGGAQLGALSPGQQISVGGSLSPGENSSFQSLNDAVHFVVTADRPAYWRTNAYDRYTGSGWEQSGTPTEYSPPIRADRSGTQVTYRVRLEQAAVALPTAWEPFYVDSGAALQVTSTRSVHATNALPAGTTYTATSYRPPRDPAVLRATGSDNRTARHQQYTQLPSDERAALTPTVDNITEGAASRYATAKRVEAWLETHKNYSLSVSAPPEGGVASQFVHEMDAGYCEYFATSMTAMLRSQNVPARYVVGYAPGERSGPDQYTVRAMHAHAWVEVYFDGVGWVRFDPTPASDRQSEQARAVGTGGGAGSGGEYTPGAVPGSPGESAPGTSDGEQGGDDNQPGTGADTSTRPTAGTPEGGSGPQQPGTPDSGATTGTESGETPTTAVPPGDESEQSEDPPDDSADTETAAPLDISLDRDPVPGATVTVTVTRNETTVEGARVSFNGDQIGVTAAAGNVTGTVPYTAELNISVTAPADAPESPPSELTDTPAQSYNPLDLRTADRSVPDGDAARTQSAISPQFAGVRAPGNNTTRSYTLETNASVSILGHPVTGNEVRIVAAVADVPLRNASVRLGDELVAETNASGMATVTLPTEPGATTVRVERDRVAGERSVTLSALNATATTAAPLALPFTAVEVSVTLDESTVSGVPVRLNGKPVGTTGPGGTLTTRLPLADAATLQVSQFGQTTTTHVRGLYRNVAIAAAGVAVLTGAVAYTKRRYGVSPRRLLAGAVSIAATTVRWLVNRFVYAATGTVAWVARGLRALQSAVVALAATVRGNLSPQVLAARFAAWLRALRERVANRSATLSEGVSRVSQSLRRDDGADTRSDYRTFREAWHTLLTHVTVRRPNRYTPGELAAHAVTRDDLPADAVATLRDEFRAVEYGHREPSARLERVEHASRAIESAAHADETDGSDAGTESES